MTTKNNTFSKRILYADLSADAIPSLSKLGNGGAIDKILDMSVLVVKYVYLRGWTEELLDYLNDIAGKDIGATSRTATGFVSNQIKKWSFFNVHVDAPRLMIPQ
jgi:hypothetical protein